MIESTTSPQELILRITSSHFEAANVNLFKTELQGIAKPPQAQLILDLEEVEFMDSSGVGTLLGLMTHFDPEAKTLTIRHAQKQIIGLIEMLRLESVLVTHR